MDVFLIRDGVVENVASFDSIESARLLHPEYTCVERTPENAYKADGEPVNIGDPAP